MIKRFVFSFLAFVLLLSPLTSSLQVSAESLTEDVQVYKGELDEGYSYEIKTVNGVKQSVKVSKDDGTDTSEIVYDKKTGQLILNGEVLSEVQKKELNEFAKLFKHDNKTPKEFKNVEEIDTPDVGTYYIPIHTGGTTWQLVGDYKGSINFLALPSAIMSAILFVLPGTQAAAGGMAVLTNFLATVETSATTLYWKSTTYKRWDTTLTPDQYMYRSGMYFYSNSTRTNHLGGFQFDHYGY